MSFLGFWYKRPIVIIRNLLIAAQSMPKRLFAILLGQIFKEVGQEIIRVAGTVFLVIKTVNKSIDEQALKMKSKSIFPNP